MMKPFLKFSALFFLAFALEVRVKASGEEHAEASNFKNNGQSEILHCFFQKSCAGVVEKNQLFHREKESFALIEGLVFKGNNLERSVLLIEGSAYILNLKKDFELQVLHGKAFKKNGDFQVRKNKDRFEFFNYVGDLTLSLRDGSVITVPEGFSVWVGGISSAGTNEVSPVQPIEKKQLAEVLPVFPLVKDREFIQKRAAAYGSLWGNNIAKASQIYKQSAQREIAMEKEAEQRKIEAQKELQRQRALKRQGFFQKAFER